MGSLKIDCIQTDNAFCALEAEWRALEPQMVQVPFVSYDWNLAWWKHLRSSRATVSDSLFIITFRDVNGCLRGVAPLMLTHRPAAGFVRLAQLQFFGADQNITEMRGMAAPATDAAWLYTEMLDYLRQSRMWDWMKLTGLPAASISREVVASKFANTYWTRELPNFYLVLKPTWEEFKSGLSRNIKESLRKCYNAPKREGLNFEFTTVRGTEELRLALDEFFRLHSLRSQLTDTIAHPNVFARPDARDFLIDVCERYAARDALRIFQLKSADKVIATRIGLISGDSIYFYYSGYDTEFAKYSVMTTTVAEAIKHCIDAGFKTINLSTGRDVSKERWSPAETLYLEAELCSLGAMGVFKYRMYRFASGALGKSLARTRIWGLIARRTQ